jgi:glutamine synthetase
MIIAEYIWLDVNSVVRSKTKVIHSDCDVNINSNVTEVFPIWNYDGSSTGQATGKDSEIILQPVAFYNSPFQSVTNNSYLVLCDTYLPDGTAHETNNRYKCKLVLDKYLEDLPMFGFEQEFFLVDKFGNVPAFSNQTSTNQLNPQGQYYCGVGEGNVFLRKPIEEAMNNCIKAGLRITGMNAEVAPCQWEIQVCNTGISACDELIMLRYILGRTLESYELNYDLSPKPITGDWNGSGCHTNFSTKLMREGHGANTSGYDFIIRCLDPLRSRHATHMAQYGTNNNLRMTGEHETSSFDSFTYGLGNRGCSVRIPTQTMKDQKGYLEDRRPGANCDPYVVARLLMETCSYD